jgi:hypothetical protein
MDYLDSGTSYSETPYDDDDESVCLQRLVNDKIYTSLSKIDKSEQLQSIIHPDLHFRRNSINILMSRRGVGKTFAVMREVIKLSHLPDTGGYTQFIYITDKINDSTVNELLALIKLTVRVFKYEEAYDRLCDIREAKTAYSQVLERGIPLNTLSKESRHNILSKIDANEFFSQIPHSILLFDDAINILKSRKYSKLCDLLFQNRQPRFTIFICLQDMYGIPPQIKRNADSIWIFAGFSDSTMFSHVCRQLGSPIPPDQLWLIYKSLHAREIMIFEYNGETQIKFLDGLGKDLIL